MEKKVPSCERNDSLSRRRFFQAGGAVLAGGALTSCSRHTARIEAEGAQVKRFRTLGRTGFKASDVSLGGLPSDGGVVRYAYDHGINYFDTAEGYGDGAAERAIGDAMEFMDRKKIFVTTKLHFEPEATKEELLERFGGCLERLKTDYADALYIHAVTSLDMVTHEGFHAAAEQLKAEGRLRHVGISSHGPRGEEDDSMEAVLTAAALDGRFDLMLLSYNFLNREEAERVLDVCKKQNVGTTAMKTMPGSLEVDPVDPDNLSEDYQNYVDRVAEEGVTREEAIERIRNWVARQQESIEQIRPFAEKHGIDSNDRLRDASLQWALQNEDMHTVCMGIQAFEDIDRFVAFSGTALSSSNAQFIEDYQQVFASHYCRHGCTACARVCPRSVPVSTIMRYGTYFALQGREKHAMRKYARLGTRNALHCLACEGNCARACPHGLDIQGKMIGMHALLSNV